MDYIERFFVFWYDFLFGDDWLGAVIVLLGFGGTYFVAQAGIIAFWVVPVAVFISISLSLWLLVRGEG